MKFSGKIEDGTSNKPLNFCRDPVGSWLKYNSGSNDPEGRIV